MKLKDFKEIIYSNRDGVCSCILYDCYTFNDIEKRCSIEYAIKNYGDNEVKRIDAEGNYLVIGIEVQ